MPLMIGGPLECTTVGVFRVIVSQRFRSRWRTQKRGGVEPGYTRNPESQTVADCGLFHLRMKTTVLCKGLSGRLMKVSVGVRVIVGRLGS